MAYGVKGLFDIKKDNSRTFLFTFGSVYFIISFKLLQHYKSNKLIEV